ncbi:MAG: ferritin-like domain-containing protein [Rhodocyclaceae bacterium]
MLGNGPADLPWRVEDLDFSRVDLQRIRHDADMLYLLAASSFIEIASDTYASNLAEYFSGDAEVVAWLSQQWEQEEIQHGRALREYVKHVWPEFDWQAAYDAFFAEYSLLCTVDEFEPSRGLEMVARCVVETGTSTFYRAIHALTDEPVLQELVTHIRADEVRHYKYFYRYFNRYNASEHNSRRRIVAAVGRRLIEARNSDAEIGLWHAFHQAHRGALRDGAAFKELLARVNRRVRRQYPVRQAVKMLLKPLHLPPALAAVQTPLAFVVERLILR